METELSDGERRRVIEIAKKLSLQDLESLVEEKRQNHKPAHIYMEPAFLRKFAIEMNGLSLLKNR